MSNTGPRRPKGESGVQRANARPAQDDPTRGSLLTSFLGNAQAASTTTDPDDVLAVALRTVLKRHETTKLKALSDIESCFQSENLTDEKAAFYAGSFAHAFRQCATSESGVVRRKICRCLSLLFARSKEVKLALARELPTVFGPWLMLSCDTWPDVAEEGARAFTLAFPDAKLKEATARFAVQSLAFLTNEVETCLTTPLPSDSTDPRVNTVASCFAALAKLVSTLRADDALVEPVLAFIRDGECMQKLIAPKGAKGGSIQKSTVARTHLIAMFASIINTYPNLKPDDSLHAAIARTAQSSMFDSDATVSHDAWSLFLVWGSAFPSLATEPVIAVVRALPGVIKDVAATPGLPSTLTTTLMPLFALCKKVPGVPTQALDAIMDTLADAAATSTDATVKASLVAAWIECWSTTVMSNDGLLSVTSALSLFFDHCHYKRNDASRVDVLCNALAGTLIRFVSRAGTTFESSSAVTEYSHSIASFVAGDLRALVGVASTAATFCSLVASADRLSAQSAAIAEHLNALNDTVGEHLLASVADVTSMTHLLTSVSKIAAARGALSRAVVTLLNGPDTVSTIAGCLVRHDALATEVVGPVEASLSPQARTALAAAFTNAGKDDVMPAFLRAAVSDLAGKAADRRDWAAVTALLKASDVSAVKQVSTALISAISKVKSIDEVDPMLRLAEQLVVAKGDDATGELSLQADAACKLLRGFSGLLIDVMPAWTVEAFAAADLEDAEPDSEDDSNASRSGGDDNGSDSRSSSSRASSSSSNVGDQESEGDADISASAATQLTVAAISRFAALCGLVAGGSRVLLEFADAVTHTVVDSEGSSTVRNGRPSPAAILAVFAKVPEAARGVLEGMLFDELVSDCLSDLEEVDPAVASRCLQRGAYQRQVLRTTLFKQPVAAVGLMAAVALDLVVVVGSSSVPHSLTGVDLWIAGLAKCRLISPVLTLKSNRAVDQLLLRALQSPNAATDVATAAAADDIFGPLITSALAGFITTHPGLPNSLKLALITRLVVTVVDRFLQEPNVHVEVLRVVLRFLEGAQLGLMTKRLSEEVTAALTNLADRSTSITVVTAALQALRLMAARPIPLSPALLKRVVALRDAAPRASADGIAVVAEAMLWSCTDAGLAMEAATVAERSIVVAFSLHHLPTNGKLGQRTPLMAPVPVESLRAFTVALHVMRRGLARLQTIHASSTADGALASLRTTMNLVDLDIACECVLRLKTISHDKSAELVDALSDVSKCIASIQRADLKTLRASPKSVAVIAQLLASLHFWICARPLKLFQQEGDDDALQQVIALTSRLASIALVESDAASALLCLVPVINRGPVKPLPGRTSDATTAVELKPRLVKRHLTQSVSTNKNCLSLQSYFAAWYACLTNESGLCQEAANRAAEAAAGRAKLEPQVGVDNRIAVYQLLDIILALAHSRPQDSTGSGHRTYITDALSGRETNRTLGFDFTLFGEAPAAAADGGGRPAAVHQLALQGFCLLSLLLQRRTVRFVRMWIEGLNRSLRAGFEALVEVYLGPALTQLALSEVIAHSPTGSSKFEPAEFNGAVSITVVDTSRTVLARFTADDVSFDVKFTVPAAYPLRPASIDQDSIKPKTRAGVPAERWRAWMLKVTMMLVNGGSTVWGCIALIAENLEKQLEGVEPCPICYSVISQTTQKLPEMSCLVCKNSKFHSACLYEWWGNSGQTSCPMCRSPWFSSS